MTKTHITGIVIALIFSAVVAFILLRDQKHLDNHNHVEQIARNSYKVLTHQNDAFVITYRVEEAGSERIIVTPADSDTPLVDEILDPLEDILVIDTNDDDYDELYLVTRSTGSGNYAEVTAITYCDGTYQQAQMRMPGSERFLPLKGGYLGHDAIWTEDDKLYWQFPLYTDNDPNSAPTGGYQRISYQAISTPEGCIIHPLSMQFIAEQ